MSIGRWMAVAIFGFVLVSPSTASARGNVQVVGVKVDPGNDHVAGLVLDATGATQKYGKLTAEEGQITADLVSKLFTIFQGKDGSDDWTGPPLILSRQINYGVASFKEVRDLLSSSSWILYNPLSMGSRGGERYVAVICRRQDAAPGPNDNLAIVAVFENGHVNRLVIAPQPWINLIPGIAPAIEGGAKNG